MNPRENIKKSLVFCCKPQDLIDGKGEPLPIRGLHIKYNFPP